MGTSQRSGRAMLLLGLCALAGCAGGGGGSTVPGIAPPPGTSNSGTATTDGVQPPPAASFGPAPAPAQVALAGGPVFFGGNGSSAASGTSFPAFAVQYTSPREPNNQYGPAQPDSTNPSATWTVISMTADTATLQLSIPSLNLSVTYDTAAINSRTTHLDYVMLGDWYFPGSSADATPSRTGNSVFGYETPTAALPVSGTAMFSGPDMVRGVTYDTRNVGGSLSGDASFSVDFATAKISGAFTNMSWSDGIDGSAPWHDISVSASIAAGTNKFTGTTALGSQLPPEGYGDHLSKSATGRIDGAFYGPAAQNLGAIWSISDGNVSAVGGVIAGRQ
jgi:transferrin binding protein